MYKESIHTNHLIIGYGKHVVRDDVTFSLREGEMVCMLGRNGSGKSTLLRTLAGLQPALGGECNLIGLSQQQLAQQLAIVLTERVGVDNTTVRDIVAMGRYPYINVMGSLTDEDERIIDESLTTVGIDKAESLRFFNALSDGEKQRVLIAKAIAQTTPIILLDEPTAHLDLPNRISVLQLLSNLAHNNNKTIIISTHELDLAMRYADRILLLTDTEIMLDTPAEMKRIGALKKTFGIE